VAGPNFCWRRELDSLSDPYLQRRSRRQLSPVVADHPKVVILPMKIGTAFYQLLLTSPPRGVFVDVWVSDIICVSTK
jgi:hypothetical protein